jgi:hypothetical protein
MVTIQSKRLSALLLRVEGDGRAVQFCLTNARNRAKRVLVEAEAA